MKHRILAALAALWATAACAAPLVITGAPNGSWGAMSARYTPIAHYLSAALHRPVVFRSADDLVDFGQFIKHRRAAIIFGGPQILSWAEKRHGYVPVLAARGSFRFVLVARSQAVHSIRSLRDGQSICGLPFPNLGTMVLFTHYTNPLLQPYIVLVPSPIAAVHGVSQGRCMAASVPINVLNRLNKTLKHPLHIVAHLGRFPNQGFAVSGQLAPVLRQQITEVLIAGARAGALQSLQAANGIVGWEPPGPTRYVGYGHLVSGVLGYTAFDRNKAP